MNVLPVGQIDPSEEGVVLRAGFPRVVLVQEDGRAPHLQAQLLDALLIVHRHKEGLAALLGPDGGQDGEVLGEHITWGWGWGRHHTVNTLEGDQR